MTHGIEENVGLPFLLLLLQLDFLGCTGYVSDGWWPLGATT